MKRYLILALLAAAFAPLCARADEPTDSKLPGVAADWFGYEMRQFKFAERDAKLVAPKEYAPGKPWIWRARFFGHEPQFDVAMLERGYAVAWLDSAPLMGSPQSVALWQKFYRYLVDELGFAPKANMEGMSRGGLYIMEWAFAYPDEVAAIYLDNPVLDFNSWPGGYGSGKRSDKDWQDVLTSWELTEEEARNSTAVPVKNVEGCKALAKRGVPILLICGDADSVVPGAENWKPFKELYESVGGRTELILKPGADHHPHSLKDPRPIVDFVLKANER